jgi:hypothetical protein
MKTIAILIAVFIIAVAIQAVLNSISCINSISGGSPKFVNKNIPKEFTGKLSNYTFHANTFILPMDDKQTDLTAAFGFAHAMLRNGSIIYRIIEPPNETIITDVYPSGTLYLGGPILFLPSASSKVAAVLPTFPAVVLHKLTADHFSTQVFVVRDPTSILWCDGGYGKTGDLLNEMKIPYKTVTPSSFKNNPGMIWNYTLFIDDCAGLYPGYINPTIAQTFRDYAVKGNEIIFTCYAIRDFNYSFPQYVNNYINPAFQTRQSNITELPDFPAQYDGTKEVTFIKIFSNGVALLPNASVIAKGDKYVDAMYYNYGKGIIEFFSFHPGEQSAGPARRAAITLYGNKFLHFAPQQDKGVWTASEMSPPKISKKGTSTPDQEECAINITVTPVSFNVAPANSMVVNYKLMPYIDNVTTSYYDGSGNPRPPSNVTVNPDYSKSIRWNINTLASGSVWKVTFNITCSKTGAGLTVNDWIESNVTFVDDYGNPRVEYIPELTVDVVNGPVTEFAMPLAVAFIAVLVLAVPERGKKR